MRHRIFQLMPNGEIWWLRDDLESWSFDKKHAGIFSEAETTMLLELPNMQAEPMSETEQMEFIGAPRLFE